MQVAVLSCSNAPFVTFAAGNCGGWCSCESVKGAAAVKGSMEPGFMEHVKYIQSTPCLALDCCHLVWCLVHAEDGCCLIEAYDFSCIWFGLVWFLLDVWCIVYSSGRLDYYSYFLCSAKAKLIGFLCLGLQKLLATACVRDLCCVVFSCFLSRITAVDGAQQVHPSCSMLGLQQSLCMSFAATVYFPVDLCNLWVVRCCGFAWST